MKWCLIIICWFVLLLFSVSLVYKDTRQVLLIEKKNGNNVDTNISYRGVSILPKRPWQNSLSEGFALYWERDTLMLHETTRNDDFERNTA